MDVTLNRKLLDVLSDYNLAEVNAKYREDIKNVLAQDWPTEQKKEEIERIIICVCRDKLTKVLTKELGDEEEAKLHVLGFFVATDMTGEEWVKLAKHPRVFLPPFRKYRELQQNQDELGDDGVKILQDAMTDILVACGVGPKLFCTRP